MSIIDELRAFLVASGYLSTGGCVAENHSLLRAGLIDSLAVVELTSHIQQVYGVQISEDDLVPENFDSLGAMKSFIDRKNGKR